MAVIRIYLALLSASLIAHAHAAVAEDWPTYNHDDRRSGVTAESLSLPLTLAWEHAATHPPSPAWPEPAKADYWHRKHDLNPRVTFDRAYHVTAVGDALFYGSSTDDSVVCLQAASGQVRWRFWTEGPVRLAPAIHGSSLYVGSDDGRVYCLDAAEGHLRWKYRAGPNDRRCLGNGRMISRWPVRSGVVIQDGRAYFAAGLFPTSEGAYLCSVDALTGEEIYRVQIDRSTQGYLATVDDRLIVPTGRTAPAVFSRDGGRLLGGVHSPGGSFAVATGDVVAAGSGDGSGEISLSDRSSLNRFVSFSGLHLLAAGDRYVIHSRDSLAALDWAQFARLTRQQTELRAQFDRLKRREDEQSKAEATKLEEELANTSEALQACWRWRVDCSHPFAAIRAGDIVFTGGDGVVAGYSTEDGTPVWSAPVDGRAYGLTASNGRLVVSTSTGRIYAFQSVRAAEAASPSSETKADVRLPESSQRLAAEILTAAKTDQGFCVLLNSGSGQFAHELAKRSRFRVICIESEPELVSASREYLHAAGVYGERVVVHHNELDSLKNYPPYFANLVVLKVPSSVAAFPDDLGWIVRPCGGVLAVTSDSPIPEAKRRMWLDGLPAQEFCVQRSDAGTVQVVIERGELPGSGTWTHGLADPGNTACSGDQIVAGPVEIQWFGAPGPRPMTDRHHRNVTPLYGDGRLFVPGENLVIAVDAYNGTTLWRRDIENSLRLGAFLDCSNMVLDHKSLNVVADDACHRLDVKTGETTAVLKMPQLAPDGPRHWGYVASAGGRLVGSGRKPNATYREQSWAADNALWYDNMSLVTSDYLFALDPESGETVWTYKSGTLLNTTLTIGGERVYFLESHSPPAALNTLGRMPMATFLEGPNFLVALDLQTGKPVWRHQIDLADCRLIAYLNYADEKLVLSGNKYIDKRLWYYFYGIDAATGETDWQQSHNSGYAPGGGHGEQNRHPTIVDDTVYGYPLAYELQTGHLVEAWKFARRGHGCGNISASAQAIFWRGGNPWRCDLAPGAEAAPINRVTRPGCWINILPAGGLLMIPEASSGCTCAFPLQTSLTYVPREGS